MKSCRAGGISQHTVSVEVWASAKEGRGVTVTKENIVPEGCPERARAELHGGDRPEAAAQVTMSQQEPAVCPGECWLLPPATPPIPCPHTALSAIAQPAGREWQGQLIWVTAKPEK